MTADHPPGLTPRQEQILAYISQGMTNREIGDQLGLAEQTVKNSVTLILAAIGVRRRAQAAVYVATRGALTGRPHIAEVVEGRVG